MGIEIYHNIFGEVFEDGQFRGSHEMPNVLNHAVTVGDYTVWEMGDGEIGITYRATGEEIGQMEPAGVGTPEVGAGPAGPVVPGGVGGAGAPPA